MNRWQKLLAAGLMIALLWALPAGAGDEQVVLITFAGSVSSEGLAALQAYGADEVTVFDNVPVAMVRIRGGANRLSGLATRDDVVSVEPDAPVFMLQQVPWGVERIGAPRAWRHTEGENVRVAVLDTGITLIHEDLFVLGGYNAINPGFPYADDHGHGSGVAGVIAALNNDIGIVGVSPAADLLSVKVLDANGMGMISWIVDGINWSIGARSRVINMSLGAASYSAALDAACQAAYDAGIVLVAAAGSTAQGITYPARFDTVVAVGMTNSNDQIPWNSPGGPEIELVAPGVNILTTGMTGYVIRTGTSYAAPHVAGTAALVRAANPLLTPHAVREIMAATALDLGYPPHLQGAGRVRAYEAVRAAIQITATAE